MKYQRLQHVLFASAGYGKPTLLATKPLKTLMHVMTVKSCNLNENSFFFIKLFMMCKYPV